MENVQMEQAHPRTTSASRVRHPKLAMVSMLLGAFVGMFSETSLNIALPKLSIAFNMSTATLQWLVTGYMLIIGIIMPLSSIISKWFSTRKIIIFALLVFILGSVLSAMAPSFALLLTGRMIQGIGTGLILPLMFAVAMQIFPPQKLGAVNGSMALVIMFAPAIGPTLTGLILGIANWRWIFWSFIPLLVIALIFAVMELENVGHISKPRVDVLSIIESIIGFSGIVAGASLSSRYGWASWQVIVSLVIGLVVLFLYVHRQLTLESPILNLKVLKNKEFTVGTILVMLDFAIILSAMYLMPQYIQNGVGIAVALTGVINAVTSAIAGRLYDNIGARRPAILGFIIAFIGAVMLAMASDTASIVYIIAAHVILMIGAPLAMSPAQTSALNSLSGREAGDGSTILNTMQQVVGALATAFATSFLELGRGAATGSAAARFTAGSHTGFYFTIALIVVAFIVSFQLKDRQRGHSIKLDESAKN
ncbi:DHA2 family efflux MFS transporter permease subunit [Limosilactobacillus fermentum]|uniref:DHA2 family efflux MFS transporter permease subunit n=1 Tax=Limosilactobacillus fermentum TaxID=1613 RepID=UPI0021C098B5|nr:DHA2 family efflux MFS transporter permease subunit [Limosilactobacillus fermentum]